MEISEPAKRQLLTVVLFASGHPKMPATCRLVALPLIVPSYTQRVIVLPSALTTMPAMRSDTALVVGLVIFTEHQISLILWAPFEEATTPAAKWSTEVPDAVTEPEILKSWTSFVPLWYPMNAE